MTQLVTASSEHCTAAINAVFASPPVSSEKSNNNQRYKSDRRSYIGFVFEIGKSIIS